MIHACSPVLAAELWAAALLPGSVLHWPPEMSNTRAADFFTGWRLNGP